MSVYKHCLDNAASLFASLGSERFCGDLAKLLAKPLQYDGLAILLFHPHYLPTVLHANLMQHDAEVFRQKYMQGAFLLDPFYQIASSGNNGLYSIREIAPEGFFGGRYFREYFCPAGINDEVNYVFQGHEGIFGLISISRTVAHPRFSEDELSILSLLGKIVIEAVKRHLVFQSGLFEDVKPVFRPKVLQNRLEEFGRAILTDREHQVVHLMLQGCSSKAVANQLGMSPATERTHRKSIYKKMGVNSHAELSAEAFHFLRQ